MGLPTEKEKEINARLREWVTAWLEALETAGGNNKLESNIAASLVGATFNPNSERDIAIMYGGRLAAVTIQALTRAAGSDPRLFWRTYLEFADATQRGEPWPPQ